MNGISESLLPAASLAALLAVVAIGGFARVNLGVLAMSVAWIVGLAAGIPAATVAAGFPSGLFVTLFAVTFLFGMARANGTLERLIGPIARHAAAGKAALPIVFFIFAAAVSACGVGNIGAVALLAPIGLAAAEKAGVGAFLMTVMIVNGANAGAFSPFAYTGIIANSLTARQGLAMNPWTQIFLPSFIAQAVIAFGAFFVLRRKDKPVAAAIEKSEARSSWNAAQKLTTAALALFIFGVAALKLDVGFLALSLAVCLLLMGAGEPEAALKAVPWDAVLMVCGMGTLIATIESSGGLELLSAFVARLARPGTAAGYLALFAGAASNYSSSSGVVMPAFIPLVPGLISRMGGGDPVALVSAINVGSHVVDVSPLSTLGALCLASASANEDKKRLFRALLFWGLSMTIVGALICHVVFDMLY